MSEHDKPESVEDGVIKQRLTADMPEPSPVHDSSILDAAREFSNEPASEQRSTVETPPEAQRVQPERTLRWAMAAAIVATTGIGAMVLLNSPAPDNVTRGESDDVAPQNGAELNRLPRQFRLPELASGLACRVALRGETGATIWTSDVFSSGQVDLETDMTEQAIAGSYSWQADCRGAGNRTFGPYRFTLRR